MLFISIKYIVLLYLFMPNIYNSSSSLLSSEFNADITPSPNPNDVFLSSLSSSQTSLQSLLPGYSYKDYHSFDGVPLEEACFICFETTTPETTATKGILVDLSDIYILNRPCDCRGKIHTQCFATWVNRTHSCPVCRSSYNANANSSINILAESTAVFNSRLRFIVCYMFSAFFVIILIMILIKFFSR
jgi:hypothetical protein